MSIKGVKEMNKFPRWMCALCAVCLMLSGLAVAEECGIGEAASRVPTTTTVSVEQAVLPATSAPASKGATTTAPASTGSSTNPLANENSTKGFVYRMYTTVLGREPDAVGFDYWVSKLEKGEVGAAEIVNGFFNSNEYIAMKKNNDAVVVDCYQAMLNRAPDAEGKDYWMARLNVGMTADAVCSGFVSSNEFIKLAAQYGIKTGKITLTKARDQSYVRTAFVYRLYKDCLERDPEVDGLEYWCDKLNKGTGGTQIASGFVFSNEYKNRLADNEKFVEMLYRAILGRDSEPAGKKYWLDQLNYTISREKALNGFMTSNEFSAKCASAGLKVGKKIAEPDNNRAWKANILVLSLINTERAKAGLPALTTREDLWERVAQVRAQEVKKSFSHTRPNGTSCFTAYDEAGFPESYEAENIAFGYKTEQDVVKAWLNSVDHRASIMSTLYNTVATSLYAKTNWAQNFYAELGK